MTDRLPEGLRGPVESRMGRAHHADSALDAHAQVEALDRELDKTTPAPRTCGERARNVKAGATGRQR